ncbi:methyltransferase [Variovorax sp. YR752]|uniref:methyltransferase n=1 Tax=Variovorax sp. YR752 TaxID=1884383 RepID=UPI0031377808
MNPKLAAAVPASNDSGAPWWQQWRVWRDRLLGDARFQRAAAAFPLTRPLARRRARDLFDLMAGFVYSQVLLACVRLQLFELLAEGPQSTAALCRRLDLAEPHALRLLAAAQALELVERRGEAWALGSLGAVLVGNAPLQAMIEHHACLYRDLGDPVALLRGERPATELGRYWAYADNDAAGELGAQRVADYSALMAASQPLIADQVLDAYPIARHRCLLDVGGGEGVFLCAAAKRAPALKLMLLDLPAVADRARERFADAGLAGRAEAIGGDFLNRPLPRGADVASLVRVMFDHHDDNAMRILRAVRAALPPDGTLLVAEPMAGTRGAEPMGDAYFGFYLMAMGSGRSRSAQRLAEMLSAAGFDRIRPVPTRLPLQAGLIVARCAGA